MKTFSLVLFVAVWIGTGFLIAHVVTTTMSDKDFLMALGVLVATFLLAWWLEKA